MDGIMFRTKLGMLIRIHNDPRVALFSIDDVKDCPVTKDQITKNHRNSLPEWRLGRNGQERQARIFLKNSKAVENDKRKKDDLAIDFAKERVTVYNADGQLSKNAKKKARGKVFDHERESKEVHARKT